MTLLLVVIPLLLVLGKLRQVFTAEASEPADQKGDAVLFHVHSQHRQHGSPIELNGRLEPTGAPLVRRRSVRENEGE